MDEKVVKVRVNASGTRVIGYVRLPPDVYRTSDVLNAPEPYLLVHEGNGSSSLERGGSRAIRKDTVSYVEALEEPSVPYDRTIKGEYHWITLEMHAPQIRMDGELFVPNRLTPYAIVNDQRRFLSLRNARLVDSVESYPFLAVNKMLTTVVEWTPDSQARTELHSAS